MAIPTIRLAASALALGLAALSASALPAVASGHGGHPWPQLESSWTEVNPDAPWSARAGLQAVTLDNTVYVLGGRVPKPPSFPPIPGDSTLLNDVWSSTDRGATWTNLVPAGAAGMWAPRGYFSAVTKGRFMYVIGGQDFRVTPNPCPPPEVAPDCPPVVSSSQFFNDVWRSADGVHWTQMTANAPWTGRAGLSAAVLGGQIYVFGGSRNDDSAVIGGPPVREYFNDVWRSRDGRHWTQVTAAAPWAKRAGAAVAVKDGAIYLLGGEVGFVCQPQPGCTPPYFNDVWRTRDGRHWTQLTASAGWSPRPGHKCEVLRDRIICFGGFGQPTNPTDVWLSHNGRSWQQLPGTAWNAGPDGIKYDFDTAVIGGPGGRAIYTFGGDRETFDFTDPGNYLRVDNDVWRFRLGR